MWPNILGALQGPAVDATDEDESGKVVESKEDQGDLSKMEKEQGKEDRNFSFWGVASALADSVKKTTAEISASVNETDWRAEIEAFGKGVADDASEVQKQAHHAAREGASRLEHLPQQAAKAKFPPVDPARVKTHFDQVGNTLGRFGNKFLTGGKDLFEQVSEAVQAELDGIEGHIHKPKNPIRPSKGGKQGGAKYSRLEADVSAMQRSSSTYCDQPEDLQGFEAWLQAFDLEAKKAEIEEVTRENAFMAELQSRIVPLIVQYDVFWTRYFYQLDRILQKHKQMQEVVQRAASSQAEDVAWDDDEEEASQAPKAATPPPPQPTAESGTGRVGRDLTPPKPHVQATQAGDNETKKAVSQEEEADTSTASDDSGNGPWTVVSSPSHKRSPSFEAESKQKLGAKPGENQQADNPKSISTEQQQEVREAEEAESEIDVSDEEESRNTGSKEDGSDVEEDWGLWD